MKTITRKSEIKNQIQELKSKGFKIGFVPTMGALHAGHISLIERAKVENDFVVCSIFVNPTQFNNKEDLKHYPRTFEKDAALLSEAGCDIIFAPEASEMYPDNETQETWDFGSLEYVMEGKFRPGHFNGVAMIVSRLFDCVLPTKAYFGEKDYQQLLVIKSMVKQKNYAIEIVGCPIKREASGLAMSSRNMRLSTEEINAAAFIYASLNKAKQLSATKAVKDILAEIVKDYEQNLQLELEYFELADAETLAPVEDWSKHAGVRAFVAAQCGPVRLIDNLSIIP